MPKQVYFNISEERREKLLKPALREFTKKPYEKVTVLSLTKTMKILRTDFYYYFSDKEDIYGAIVSNLFGEQKEDIHAAVLAVFDKVLKLKGPKNRQYLIELSESYHPQFAFEIAGRLIDLYPCDCDHEKKQVKVITLIYKLMTVINLYERGELSEAKAKEILTHQPQSCCK